MKYIIKIGVIIMLWSMVATKVQAQQTALAYLQSFETNKSEYINKPFSYLINKITLIEPSEVYSDGCMNNMHIARDTKIYFVAPYSGLKGNRDIYIIITWLTPILTKDVAESEKQEGGNRVKYTEAKKKFYGDRIIKNIEVIEE